MKRTILLYDPDREYAERIADYARNSYFRKEVEVTVCTRPELFAEWLRDGRFDVFVAAASAADEIPGVERLPRPVVWLGEEGGRVDSVVGTALCKYEAAPKLLRAWLDRAAGASAEGKRASIVGVWSAAGGVGKTRIIACLAEAWVRSGVRTFVAGFDPGGGLQDDVAAGRDVSEWLYSIKSGRPIGEELPAALGAATLYGFSPASSYREWASVGRREAEALLEAATLDVCDGIVLADAGTGWSPWAEVVWGRSDEILCVSSEDPACLEKTEKWLNDWPEWEERGAYRAKTRFALNRCLNLSGSECYGWTRGAFRLPYVPEWKQDAARRDPAFQAAGERLAEEVRARCAPR
ncbi:hypothetical protein FE782_21070 [Paenibacillus antri]|uniref:ParA family protein n=1 Tax=Paenibacillus antri TaxID=2582848 RepID=A0A5R9G9W5_9BACL|nr:hypothetical protein [Paenibacillus antri]TLS50168.1 hypothetical protein FE782_21070 [Paenibacillus antri]